MVGRTQSAMLSAADAPGGRVPLMLDTNVYIAEAAGRLPPAAQALLDRALPFHCSVCLAELAIGIANGDPSHRNWVAVRDHYAEVLAAIPETRVLAPNRDTWLDAGLLAGIFARTQGFQSHQRKDMLNDALIFLVATQHGLPVLTSNGHEFDLLQQLAAEGVFYVY